MNYTDNENKKQPNVVGIRTALSKQRVDSCRYAQYTRSIRGRYMWAPRFEHIPSHVRTVDTQSKYECVTQRRHSYRRLELVLSTAQLTLSPSFITWTFLSLSFTHTAKTEEKQFAVAPERLANLSVGSRLNLIFNGGGRTSQTWNAVGELNIDDFSGLGTSDTIFPLIFNIVHIHTSARLRMNRCGKYWQSEYNEPVNMLPRNELMMMVVYLNIFGRFNVD